MKKIYSVLILIILLFDIPCAMSSEISVSAFSVCHKGMTVDTYTQDGDTTYSSSRDVYKSGCGEYKIKMVLLQESFDNGILPVGWMAVDNDGDGYTWDAHTPRCIYTKHEGPGCISSASFINNVGALTPDNWLITPAIAIPDSGNTNISWWTTAQDLRYNSEHYEVYVSHQTSAIADFDTIALFEDTLTTARDYWQHSLDISAYAGQIIYIAFVHNKCNDQYWLNLDDILVEFTPYDSVRNVSGVYTYFEIDNQGSVDTVNLHYTVYPIYDQTENLVVCQSELPYVWRDTLFDETTVSSDHVFYRQSCGGCDSVVTLHLTVNYSTVSDTTVIACGSYTWFGTTYTQSGVYEHTLTNTAGCDSVITLTLTINPVYNQTENVTICQNELPYTWRDTLFAEGTVSGTYFFHKQTVGGCDSVVNLNLTVNPMYVQSENLTVCQHELPFVWRDTLFAEGTVSGDFLFSRQSLLGCDSVVTLHLTVNSDTESDTVAISCDSFNWFGTTYTQSGVYEHTLTNAVGCDSVITLTLTINPVYNQTENVTICQNELPYTWRDTLFAEGTVSGTYLFHKQTAGGCDSIVNLNLTVNPMYVQSENLTVCQHELPFAWRDTLFAEGTVSGDFLFNRQSLLGCDSVVTLHLTVNSDTESDTVAISCDSFNWFGNTYNQSGEYTHTLTNVMGCDSVVTLHLTINHSTTSVDVREACDSLVWIDGVLYTESTDAPTVTLTNAVGCDSVVNLHLTINYSFYLDVFLTIDENDLPYTYGDTTFEPGTVQSGDYPFYFITADGCDSTIVLHLTVLTGIDDHDMAAAMNVYPNPTTDKVNVQLKIYNEPVSGVEIQVYDMYGKWLNSWQMTGEITEIDLSSYVSGVYFIKAVHEQSMLGIRKVLKH